MSLEININEKHKLTLENEQPDWDLQELPKGGFHILFKGKSYEASVLEFDKAEKKLSLMINRNTYHLEVKDQMDLLLEKLGMDRSAGSKINEIKAPMPGLVLDINVEIGQEIAKGDAVLVLEAMKMENVLKSPGAGVVKSIEIKKGEAVEKGQVLIRLS